MQKKVANKSWNSCDHSIGKYALFTLLVILSRILLQQNTDDTSVISWILLNSLSRVARWPLFWDSLFVHLLISAKPSLYHKYISFSLHLVESYICTHLNKFYFLQPITHPFVAIYFCSCKIACHGTMQHLFSALAFMCGVEKVLIMDFFVSSQMQLQNHWYQLMPIYSAKQVFRSNVWWLAQEWTGFFGVHIRVCYVATMLYYFWCTFNGDLWITIQIHLSVHLDLTLPFYNWTDTDVDLLV